MRGGSQVCEDRGEWGALEGASIEGVDENVNWGGLDIGIKLGQDAGGELAGLGWESRERRGEDERSEGKKDLAAC